MTTAGTGGWFTSRTVTVNWFVTLICDASSAHGLSSVTTTVIVCVSGPWASVGVHEIAPVAGSIVMPSGGDTRWNVSAFSGISASVACAATCSGVSSSRV
jgi:hypothetical protein